MNSPMAVTMCWTPTCWDKLDGNGTQGRGVEWSCLRRKSHPNLGMEQLI